MVVLGFPPKGPNIRTSSKLRAVKATEINNTTRRWPVGKIECVLSASFYYSALLKVFLSGNPDAK